ncbi:putative protein TPRXL isoform X2 [Olea europaea var. sylvestris]|uniref:Uncharacterized protein n=1 Tax=Olea europaea subsp. europaea TaxID=158383 RepID=A0A8S0S2I1_OLEEU|nr:putative protein TPRXL isoform X2 [Olea europaea var. sylvestris]CAA2985570.1 Hypothetical predicted protein [Olea europaea subsp. europaea]
MGSETNPSSSAPVPTPASPSSSLPASPSSSLPASPSGKRSRDPEDEVYLDNLRSHKRYLSEIMASSLNGLTVGDPLSENLMESPQRDELPLQYSPMSEDSDDSRYYETLSNSCSSKPESLPASPVSPYRYQRPYNGFASGPPTTSYPSMTSSQHRQQGSDTEARFPSSPSDICHPGDLRRAALLRSVQMRGQPLGSSPFEPPCGPGQEPGHTMETEERPCSYMKTLVNESEKGDESAD